MIAWLSDASTSVVSFVGHLNEGELRLLGGAVSAVTVLISVFAITRPLRYQKSAALLDQAVLAVDLHGILTHRGCGYFLGLIYVANPRLSRYSMGLR